MRDESILKQRQRSNTADIISSICITVMMILICLLATTAAAKVYKNIVVTSSDNFELRTSLSYVAAKIRSADSVTLEEYEEYGTVIRLDEEFDGECFSTYILHKDGFLCEIMQDASMELDTDGAVEVMEIAEFYAEQLPDGILLRAINSTHEEESLTLIRRTGRVGMEKS